MLPNDNIKRLSPYIPIPHEVWNICDKDIIKLDWNESSIQPSPKVFQDIKLFLKHGNLNWYPNTKNYKLLDAIASYANQDSNEYVEIFSSSDSSHENIIDVFLNKDDLICIVSPTYDNFRARANGVGIKTTNFILENNFYLDFVKLDSFIKENKIKLLYLCNPNNPTGNVYDINNIEDLIKKNQNVIFLIDEAYYEFSNESVSHLVKKYKNLIITRTFSKAFGLASFRIGYVISHYENINHINKLRNSKSVSMLSQVAALAALNDLKYMKNYVNEIALAREYFINNLKNININVYENSKANFVLINTKNSNKLLKYLKDRKIFIRDYNHCLLDHVRISIGTIEQMKLVFSIIKDFYEEQ